MTGIETLLQNLHDCLEGRTLEEARGTLRWAISELQRVARGDFTEEEIHNLCHNLQNGTAPVSLEQFAEGCRQEMLKLFGSCPWDGLRDDLLKLRHLNEVLTDRVAQSSRCLTDVAERQREHMDTLRQLVRPFADVAKFYQFLSDSGAAQVVLFSSSAGNVTVADFRNLMRYVQNPSRPKTIPPPPEPRDRRPCPFCGEQMEEGKEGYECPSGDHSESLL